MTEQGELDTTTAEGRRFLQQRVARFGLVVGLLFLGFLTFRVVVDVASGLRDSLTDFLEPSMYMHLAGGLSMLGVWASCRSRERSERFVRAAEAIGLLMCALAMATMTLGIPWYSHPELIVALALSLGLFARAVYVPSTARRTAILGSLTGLIAVVGVHLAVLGSIRTNWIEVPGLSPDDPIALYASGTAVGWWVLIIALTTLASRVIFGLRRRIHETEKLGQYHLIEELGRGAMGVVYRASHAMLRRDTAIKLLLTDVADDADIDRFEREVRLTAKLSHPNTITIYDYGRTPQGVFYYAMELLDGADLEHVVQRDGRQPPGRVAKVLYEAASALAEAHEIGLVHRDIKPANIMLCEQGGQPDVTKLVDFGLVRHMDPNENLTVTDEHVVVGTPYYMAPECFAGAASAEARSDIYALGAVAYFMLTSALVFEGNTIMEICTKHVADAPVPPSERLGEAVDEDLERLILECLGKSVEDRPQTAAELRRRVANLACFGSWSPDNSARWWSEWTSAHQEPSLGTAPTEIGTIPIDLVHRR